MPLPTGCPGFNGPFPQPVSMSCRARSVRGWRADVNNRFRADWAPRPQCCMPECKDDMTLCNRNITFGSHPSLHPAESARNQSHPAIGTPTNRDHPSPLTHTTARKGPQSRDCPVHPSDPFPNVPSTVTSEARRSLQAAVFQRGHGRGSSVPHPAGLREAGRLADSSHDVLQLRQTRGSPAAACRHALERPASGAWRPPCVPGARVPVDAGEQYGLSGCGSTSA